MDGPRLSLVLPAYNEQAGLCQAIAEADEALRRMCVEYEILVVDDGSCDDTAAIVRAERRPNVRLLQHATNLGYGAALRTGFEAARFDLVAFTDADCQFHLDDLAGMLPLTAVAPIVVGYRVDRKDPWRRCFLSRGYNLLARTLLGTRVRDIDCALKVFRRDAVGQILPEARGFFVNTEMLTRAAQEGLDVQEVGVQHRPRLRGVSTVSLREVPRTLGHLLPFWWSKVLFAGSNLSPSSPPISPGTSLRGLLLVLLVASLLFFSRLRAPLLEPQEARYAEIPRQMLALNEFLVPSLHGEDYLDKPPLFYWAIIASYQIFGVHDWAARIIPGLAGVLTVLATYLWGRRVLGERAGLISALVLCLMPGFLYRARMLTFDTLLMLWVVTALGLAHVALITTRRRWAYWLLSACACGLGFLTKGPVALVLIAIPIFLLTHLDSRLHRITLRAWAAYLGIALAVAAPWYVAVGLHDPGFLTEFFWKHNVVRFVAPFDHSKPVWYYLPALLTGLTPWWLLLPGVCLLLRDRAAAAQRPAALGFALMSCTWMVVFFSTAGCKRPTYLLPALPPLALVFGWYLHQGLDRWRVPSLSASAAAGVVLAGSAAVCLLALTLRVVPISLGYTLAALAVGGLAVVVWTSPRIAWRHTAAIVFAASLVGVQVLLPAYNDLFSLRSQLRRTAGSPEREGRAVVCYPQRYDSVSYYLRASEVRVFGPAQRHELLAHLTRHPGTLLLVKSGSALEGLLKVLPRDVEFRARRSRAAFVVGRVVRKGEEPDRMLASWDD